MNSHLHKQTYFWIVLVVIMIGCNKEQTYFELTAPEDQMHITVSEPQVVLRLDKADEEAVELKWKTATSRGNNTSLTYGFRLFQTTKPSNVTELIDLEDTQSFHYDHQQLNDVLLSWNILPGTEVDLTAQVIATVQGSSVYMKPEISTVDFLTTGYGDTLYLFYMENNTLFRVPLSVDAAQNRTYRWEGQLPETVFWFSTREDSGYPGYARGNDASSLVYQVEEEGSTPFELREAGYYNIIVDFENMQIQVQ